jgi:hypothetical protein
MERGFYTLDEIAKALNISYWTVYRWVNRYYVLPASFIKGNWFIPKIALKGELKTPYRTLYKFPDNISFDT